MKTKPIASLLLMGCLFAALAFPGLATAAGVDAQAVPFQGKRPRVELDAQGNIHLIYHDQGNIFYCRKNVEDKDYSPPIQVNSVDKCAAVGDLSLGKNGQVHVFFHGNIFYIREQIKGEDRKLSGQDIKYAFYTRLAEDGKSFENQRDMADGIWGFDGGCTVASDPNGRVFLFVNGMDAVGKETDRKVFLKVSDDSGVTFSKPRAIDLGMGVCACCHLDSALSPDGSLMLVYRVAEQGVNRNSFVLKSTDHGRTFSSIPLDQWELRACPGSLYSFSVSGQNTYVSWRTMDEIYFKDLTARVPVSPMKTEMKRRAAVIGSNQRGELLMAWAEGDNFNKPHDLCWQVFNESGAALGPIGRKVEAFPRWGNPAVYSDASGDFVVLY